MVIVLFDNSDSSIIVNHKNHIRINYYNLLQIQDITYIHLVIVYKYTVGVCSVEYEYNLLRQFTHFVADRIPHQGFNNIAAEPHTKS